MYRREEKMERANGPGKETKEERRVCVWAVRAVIRG